MHFSFLSWLSYGFDVPYRQYNRVLIIARSSAGNLNAMILLIIVLQNDGVFVIQINQSVFHSPVYLADVNCLVLFVKYLHSCTNDNKNVCQDV